MHVMYLPKSLDGKTLQVCVFYATPRDIWYWCIRITVQQSLDRARRIHSLKPLFHGRGKFSVRYESGPPRFSSSPHEMLRQGGKGRGAAGVVVVVWLKSARNSNRFILLANLCFSFTVEQREQDNGCVHDKQNKGNCSGPPFRGPCGKRGKNAFWVICVGGFLF